MHLQLNINLRYDPQMKENSLLTCSRYVSVFKESICIFKLLYNVVWESTVCNWWPAPKMLETSEGYGRWERNWRGCCPCTGYRGRFGSTTNFSVSVTKLSMVSVRNTHSWKHRRVKPSKYRYIRQGITLIGPHCEAFTNGLGTIRACLDANNPQFGCNMVVSSVAVTSKIGNWLKWSLNSFTWRDAWSDTIISQNGTRVQIQSRLSGFGNSTAAIPATRWYA